MTTPHIQGNEEKCTCAHLFELRGERECKKHPRPHIQGNEEIIKEWKRKTETLDSEGGFIVDLGEEYESCDFDMDVMEEWFRDTLEAKDQACRETGEKERERILKILDEMEDHTARNVVLYHLTPLPTKDSI